jgi:hypothetical protein
MDELYGAIILGAVLAGTWAAWGPRSMMVLIIVPFLLWLALCTWAILPERDRGVDLRQCYGPPGKQWCAER